MKAHKGRTTFRATCRIAALLGVTILAACATSSSGGGSYVDNPEEWQAVDLAEADLNVPLVAPLEVASLQRRVGSGNAREEIYTFHDAAGYVKTSRVIGGTYSESVVRSIRGGSVNRDYIASLSLPSADTIVVPVPWAFLNGRSRAGKFLSRGFAAGGSAPPRYKNCFVSRVAYLFVELEAVDNNDGEAFDTVVEVLLCGDLPSETDLLRMMAQVDAVKDREAFRAELSRQAAGAI